MPSLFCNLAYALLLIVTGVYAVAMIAVFAALFVTAILLDAVFAGWTRSRTERLNRAALLETPDLARR